MTDSNRVLLGGCLLTGTLGSIHAFSVFVRSLESLLEANRAQVSAIYSLALVCLTIAVWAGHRLYPKVSPPRLAISVCVVAALGLAIAGASHTLYGYLFGYSFLFGGANGIGYGMCLYVVSRAMPDRTGFGIGAVTAVYALGATLFVSLFEKLVSTMGIGATLYAMAAILLVIAVAVGRLFSGSIEATAAVRSASEGQQIRDAANALGTEPEPRLLVQLWFGYGLGVIAGLMAIGHAAGIVEAAGGSMRQVVRGAMLIGMGNALGGFTAGWLVDRSSARTLLFCLSLLSSIMLAALALSTGIQLTLGGLVVLGFAYGAIIAVYPVATVTYYGAEAATKKYGRIFVAWGVAGLLGPWLAGVVYDSTGGYAIALGLASVAALLSAGIAIMLPKMGPNR